VTKKNKTVYELRMEKESKCTFADFPIGRRVQIVTPCEDFTFFYDETGVVVNNTGKYLGISVKLDEPRHYKDGTIMHAFNFNPKSLIPLETIYNVEVSIGTMKTFMTKEDYKFLAGIPAKHLLNELGHRKGVTLIPIMNGEELQTSIVITDHTQTGE
jgi:hypothetical protein